MTNAIEIPSLKFIRMSQPKTITLTKDTAVSLGLAITIFGAIVFNEVRFANLQAQTDHIINGISTVSERLNTYEAKYITKENLDLRLRNMELQLEAIDNKIGQIGKE